MPPLSPDDTQSPCQNICVMDHAAGFCVGCGRTVTEITHWLGYAAEARRAINVAARNRLEALKTAPSQRR